MTDNTDGQESMRWIRIRLFLVRRFVPLVFGLLVLGLLAGAVAYQTYAHPGVEVEERTVVDWEERTSLSHQAEVQRPNMVFEQGQTLSDRQTYFTHLSPELEGIYEYSYSAGGGGELDTESTAMLRLRSVDTEGGIYWERTEPLDETKTEGLSPDEVATLPVTVNVTDITADVERTQESLGSSIGTTEIAVVFDTRVTGTVAGEPVANAHQDTLTILTGGMAYQVESNGLGQQSHERTETTESEVVYGPFRSYGPVGVVFASFTVIAALAATNYRGRLGPSEAEVAAFNRRQHRDAFDDWISTGTVPEEALTGSRIDINSLKDLVDVAIDTDKRVLEDSAREAFYVLAGGRYYTYAPDDNQTTDESAPKTESAAPTFEGGKLTTSNTVENSEKVNPDTELVQLVPPESEPQPDNSPPPTNDHPE